LLFSGVVGALEAGAVSFVGGSFETARAFGAVVGLCALVRFTIEHWEELLATLSPPPLPQEQPERR